MTHQEELRAYDHVVKALDEFKGYQQGWDTYGGKPISEKCIAKAKEMAWALLSYRLQAVPCSDGSVQLELHRDGLDIEILISES